MSSCNGTSPNSSVGAKVTSFFRRLVTSHKDDDTHTCIPHEKTRRALDLYQQLDADSGVIDRRDRPSPRRAQKSAKSCRKVRGRGKQNREAADTPEVPQRETTQASKTNNDAASRYRRDGVQFKRAKTTDTRSQIQRVDKGTKRSQQEQNNASGISSASTRLSDRSSKPTERRGRLGSGKKDQSLEKNDQGCRAGKIRPKTCVVREPKFVWRGTQDGLESIPLGPIKDRNHENNTADINCNCLKPCEWCSPVVEQTKLPVESTSYPIKAATRDPKRMQRLKPHQLPPWPAADPLDGLEELLDDVVRMEERIRLRRFGKGSWKTHLYEEPHEDKRDFRYTKKMHS